MTNDKNFLIKSDSVLILSHLVRQLTDCHLPARFALRSKAGGDFDIGIF